jgi:hypothetical protein
MESHHEGTGREMNTSGELTGRGFGQSSGVWRLAEINGDGRLLLLVDAVVDTLPGKVDFAVCQMNPPCGFVKHMGNLVVYSVRKSSARERKNAHVAC